MVGCGQLGAGMVGGAVLGYFTISVFFLTRGIFDDPVVLLASPGGLLAAKKLVAGTIFIKSFQLN